ncbi:hypothetical protein CgunFtcFv8_009150 [Champsocephalus gunnari]|uniref:Deoxyribonuclease n=1 Tax=Champsocephalus gunnari TaxID=52237 RepID=A0AAN8D1D2_CHAGU|nr:hypothetical protein CgunFtcFv8_009150 [Champsocephalus gunnari]
MRLLWALGLFSALLHVTSCLLIGAFNIQKFGDRKSRNKDVMDIIKEIVLRYDIILIQEVLDKDLTATKRLMDLVNKGSPQFRAIVSDPLGPTKHKERYLFLYRHNKVSVKDWFQYDVKGFDRPPFVVQFSSTETGVDFVLIPIHTKPESAVKEIDALVDVVEAAREKWKNNNIVVLGDFNAGGTYVRTDDWKNIRRLRDNLNFHWLIDDNVDTAVLGLPKAYDRIVVTTDMKKGVLKAGVFKAYGLGDQALAVSDHFPVEVELKPLRNAKKRGRESDETSPKDYPVGIFLQPRSIE